MIVDRDWNEEEDGRVKDKGECNCFPNPCRTEDGSGVKGLVNSVEGGRGKVSNG